MNKQFQEVSKRIGRKYTLKNVGVRGHLQIDGIKDEKFWVSIYSHGHFKTAIWSAQTILKHTGKEIFE